MVSLLHAPGVPDRPCRSELRRTIRPAGAKKVGTPPGEIRRCTPARSRVPADEDRRDVVPLGVVARCPRHDEPGRGGMVPEALGVRRGRSPARRHRHPIGQGTRGVTRDVDAEVRSRPPGGLRRETVTGTSRTPVPLAQRALSARKDRSGAHCVVVRVKHPSVVVPTMYPASSIRSAPAAIRPSGYGSVCVTRPELAVPGGTSAAWAAPSASSARPRCKRGPAGGGVRGNGRRPAAPAGSRAAPAGSRSLPRPAPAQRS